MRKLKINWQRFRAEPRRVTSDWLFRQGGVPVQDHFDGCAHFLGRQPLDEELLAVCSHRVSQVRGRMCDSQIWVSKSVTGEPASSDEPLTRRPVATIFKLFGDCNV